MTNILTEDEFYNLDFEVTNVNADWHKPYKGDIKYDPTATATVTMQAQKDGKTYEIVSYVVGTVDGEHPQDSRTIGEYSSTDSFLFDVEEIEKINFEVEDLEEEDICEYIEDLDYKGNIYLELQSYKDAISAYALEVVNEEKDRIEKRKAL